MHNPTRHANNGKSPSKKRYVPGLNDGIRHSDIMKRHNGASGDSRNLTSSDTPFGYANTLFDGDEFVVRFETLAAGSSIGFGMNPKGDRCVRVLTGLVFVTDSNRTLSKVLKGGHFVAKRGTKYGFATSGTEGAEILVVESANYQKTWKSLEAGVVASGAAPAAFETAAVRAAREAAVTVPAAVTVRNAVSAVVTRRDSKKAKEYAIAAARDKAARQKTDKPVKKAILNANSSTAIGVNLRPMGAAAFSDD